MKQRIGEIGKHMESFCAALEQRAEELHVSGKDPDVAKKVAMGADTMRDSGNLYLTWARHFAALAEGSPEASEEDDAFDLEV
ncbi:MAG: hypothetical protein ACREI3_02035 [Nitrospirales bacterium]